MPNDATSPELSMRLFRRRKSYRKRGEAEVLTAVDDVRSDTMEDNGKAKPLTIEELISHHGYSQEGGEQKEDATRLPAAQILRKHKAAQRRRGGIEFSNSSHTRINSAAPETSDALTEKDDTPQEIKTVVDRFAPQTGQVADVDKHM